MKIISRGIDPVATPLQATCNGCNTVFEFVPSEAKYISDQRDGDCYLIACPVCHANVYRSKPSQYGGPYA